MSYDGLRHGDRDPLPRRCARVCVLWSGGLPASHLLTAVRIKWVHKEDEAEWPPRFPPLPIKQKSEGESSASDESEGRVSWRSSAEKLSAICPWLWCFHLWDPTKGLLIVWTGVEIQAMLQYGRFFLYLQNITYLALCWQPPTKTLSASILPKQVV